MISIILPTYNEAENIILIIPRICDVLRAAGLQNEVVVVDDNSPDGTGARAEEIAKTYPVQVHVRTIDRGLASAVIHGLKHSRGDICVIMDADMSHPVEKIVDMVRPIIDGQCEATVGSRYIPGGGCDDWPLIRRIISRGAGLLARGITKLSDPTTGFMALKKSIIENVELNPVGWKIVLEIVTRTNCKLIEVPFIFRDRTLGTSKLDHRAHLQYLQHLWRLYGFKLPQLMEFVRFCLVGFSGLFLDTVVLVACVEWFYFDPRSAAVNAFVAAVSWNYVLNKYWTFNYGIRFHPTVSYFSFVLVCLTGLVARIGIMHVLIEWCGFDRGKLYIVANFIGIVVATVINFAGSKFIAFSPKQMGDHK